MEQRDELRSLLQVHPEYRYLLFRRGYLLTNSEDISPQDFPFYGHWNRRTFGQIGGKALSILTHEDQSMVMKSWDDNNIALIGHAYNPYTMEVSEEHILTGLIDCWRKGRTAFLDKVSELTGTFVILLRSGGTIFAVQDAGGLKACFYGKIDQGIHISSHPQLISDVEDLSQDPFIKKLVATRMYNIGNRYLPGSMSPFSKVKRLGANTFLELHEYRFRVKRFYPFETPAKVVTDEDVRSTVEDLAETLSQSIKAITLKWSKPAISLSGGIDSKTTLAAASKYHNRLQIFSFNSRQSEKEDAESAAEICRALGLGHKLYVIPESNDLIQDFGIHRKIIDHNSNYSRNMPDNEIRKMAYLEKLNDFDVEIKSWASETVRVFMEKKYDMPMPKRLSPRHFSIFQTRYFGSPRLLKKTDQIYADFIEEIEFSEASNFYEAADLYHWEVRLGNWGSSVVTAFDYCHEVTIPYNNRRFREKFMALPRQMRKVDDAHLSIMSHLDPSIEDTGKVVKNRYFSSYRRLLEKMYYKYRIFGYAVWQKLLPSNSD